MMNYVLTFLFTPDYESVWLIEKQKPSWQKGLLNGIGGKIEKGESPINAALRELKEESSIDLTFKDIKLIGHMEKSNTNMNDFCIDIFAGLTDKILMTNEKEIVKLIPVNNIKQFNLVDTIPFLIESCLLFLKSDNVNIIKLFYH